MRKSVDIHFWTFDGAPVSWNHRLFPVVILDPAVVLKVSMNFNLTWFRFFSTNILIYEVCGVIIYINRLMLGTILVMFVSLPFLGILWSINNEDPMEIEDYFIWVG